MNAFEFGILLVIIALFALFGVGVWFGIDALNDWRASEFDYYDCDDLLLNIQEKHAYKYDFALHKWVADECWRDG